MTAVLAWSLRLVNALSATTAENAPDCAAVRIAVDPPMEKPRIPIPRVRSIPFEVKAVHLLHPFRQLVNGPHL